MGRVVQLQLATSIKAAYISITMTKKKISVLVRRTLDNLYIVHLFVLSSRPVIPDMWPKAGLACVAYFYLSFLPYLPLGCSLSCIHLFGWGPVNERMSE